MGPHIPFHTWSNWHDQPTIPGATGTIDCKALSQLEHAAVGEAFRLQTHFSWTHFGV